VQELDVGGLLVGACDRGVLRIRPGESIDYVHEWDGYAGLANGVTGTVGLPPSGPAREGHDGHRRLGQGAPAAGQP
jgi:hypothetical protein